MYGIKKSFFKSDFLIWNRARWYHATTEQQKHELEVRKQDSDKAIKEKELNFKEKELQVKKEIEQLKAETALKVAKQNKNKYDSKSKK